MTPLQISILLALTLPGAWVSARFEAKQYHLQLPLNHTLLVIIRATAAIILIRIVDYGPWDPIAMLKALAMMAGVFAPAHRLTLNLTRKYKYPSTNKTAQWHDLTMKGYDRLTLFIRNAPLRFVSLCAAELSIAILMGRWLHQ